MIARQTNELCGYQREKHTKPIQWITQWTGQSNVGVSADIYGEEVISRHYFDQVA